MVNDTLGHAAGDQVLKEMAVKIQDCLRQGDALGRLGGDEFLVVLPGADREALQAVYRRIGELDCRAGEGDRRPSPSPPPAAAWRFLPGASPPRPRCWPTPTTCSTRSSVPAARASRCEDFVPGKASTPGNER